MSFLNLIRWKNLAMIVLVQLLIKYALLEPFGIALALDGLGIILLILATVSIAAAGNIINDIYDKNTDVINKPNKIIIGKSISEKTAYNSFIICNIIGVGIGFYLSHRIGKSSFFTIFVLISALLYIYSFYLKGIILIGNILISLLVAASILIVGLFELTPTLTALNRNIQLTFFNIILDYAIFAFMISLLREMVKDIEDIDGDYQSKIYTLPIAIGRERTRNIVAVSNSIPTVILIFYVVSEFYKQPLLLMYFLGFVIGPLLYVSIKLFSAKTKQHFHHISTLYKWIMLFGMLSMLSYTFIL
ncbi:geranylgeranylglycerol-phosphate geranylgeranyltransferase [Hyunsoonleella pacifica]|uniref:Prenyltransferase n=1 Tax=Hyunsoonleella pacifica TaxID=1080224 RepID=A0A4Q9FXD1_9FLAO|nr:geranylgeranylglycerol-phosphate geranylgeranyltransferase [Hyunsoonleella pacifica]TBN19115.1 prenyltransferase [Hyunsoonleella pacifica]GGD07423.1 prenyltransferase [Hyunsoonleella pacifica]